MPKYVLRRSMNLQGETQPTGWEIPEGTFDEQKLGQLIRIRWVREVVDEEDPNDKKRYTGDGHLLPAYPQTPMTLNEAVTLAETTGETEQLGTFEDDPNIDPTVVDDAKAVDDSSQSSPPAPREDDAKTLNEISGLTDGQKDALNGAGFMTYGDVRAASDEQLLAVAGIGDRALGHLRTATE